MPSKPKVARATHANRGIESAYRRSMLALIDQMNASVEYWLTAGYRKEPPRMAALVEYSYDADLALFSGGGRHPIDARRLALDASPALHIKRVLADLADRWIKRFDEWAPKIAEAYLRDMFKASDSSMRAALKDAGWTVEFKMTPAVRDAFQASLAENVGLIRSIPEQYLGKVEGIVMRSYSAGRDLQTMVKDLKALYPQAAHRAELIARDQSGKANAVVNRARQLELGITEAVWLHSHAGKTPRPDHVAANGKRYKIAEGCLISGEYIQPGEEINCRCTSRPILPI